jgi:putative two-component system hydrogenase maturation factor HypX/HoxX
MRQADRAIDWERDDTATVVRKIRAADGQPGMRDHVRGVDCFLFGAHVSTARDPGAKPGDVIAHRRGALLRATRDGAVWITHAKPAGEGGPAIKLPAADVLGAALRDVAVHGVDAGLPVPIVYEEQGEVGIVHFAFHNGAMSAGDCDALRDAIVAAKRRPTRVIVLAGGPDFWSNGLDLNRIEASGQPADASWSNIVAMNRVVREIVLADRHVTIAAVQGNAGAGGCFLALAADEVIVRTGAVLNPHYRAMGNLYGSEYWTYLLPRRLGPERAASLVAQRQPMTGAQAARIGLADQALGDTPAACLAATVARAHSVAGSATLGSRVARKRSQRAADEAARPLERYAEEELERMRLNFYGFDPSYHVARRQFVCKLPKARTPSFLARHRALAPRAAGEHIPLAG